MSRKQCKSPGRNSGDRLPELEQPSLSRREFLHGSAAVAGLLVSSSSGLLGMHASASIVDPDITKVLVMFKCHLDVGFSNRQEVVVRKYFDVYYPQAIRIAGAMRNNGKDRYIWTTGSWLLYQYLEQANSEQRKEMDKAVQLGDISWHALPFNWQTEMLDRSMIQGSLGLSQYLDHRYGTSISGAKMTDVPCHSRGLIAPLAQGGITFLDIGVNPASTPPEVPTLFVWKNPQGESLIVMYHHHDYGGTVKVPNSHLAIDIHVKPDNSGPDSLEEIHAIYANLRQQFPNAEIQAATLTEIAHAVSAHKGRFPVITDEIGDTWIYGVSSDPIKVARYRELSRLRREWIPNHSFAIGDVTDRKLLANLLLAPEHTWGTDTKRYLDYDHYTPRQLATVIDTPPYRVMKTSWAEKRNNLTQAIATLPPTLRQQAEQRLRALHPAEPNISGLQVQSTEEEIRTAHFILAIDPDTGAIRRLYSKAMRREWADAEHPLALFVYQTLSQANYDEYFNSYIVSRAPWARKDFGKPNIKTVLPESREWKPKLVNLWSGRSAHGHRLVARLQIIDADANRRGLVAWPTAMYTEIVLDDAEPVVRVQFSCFGKVANRLPESLWFSFLPLAPEESGWTLSKVDQPISPFRVVAGGNRHMHAISDCITYKDPAGELSIETMDAPLVALGKRSPLYFSNSQPDMRAGVHFSLYNNAWGTNYIQWFGESTLFRFFIRA